MRRVLLLVASAGAVLFSTAASTVVGAEGDVPPSSAPFQWVSIGPTMIDPTGQGYDVVGSTGRVSSISVASTGLFVATANGGVWKRSSSGTWSPLTEGEPNLAFGAVAVAPSDARVIYAGTGEDHGGCVDCAPGNDLYKSTDGGATWKTLTPPAPVPAIGMQTSSIAVDRVNANDVWVGGTLGVFHSQDGGTAWTTIATIATANPNVLPPTIVDLKLDPAHAGVAYFSDRQHVWKYNASANPMLTDITAPSIAEYETQYSGATFAIALAVAPSNANVIYAAYAFSGNVQAGCMAGLYKSSDGGGTWVNVSVLSANDYFSMGYAYRDNSTGCQGWYDSALAVDPADENHLVAAGVALVDFNTSVPATPNQRNLSTASHVHPDHHALAFDSAGNLYDGNDGGVWYFPKADLAQGTPGAGQNLSQGLAVTTFSAGVSLFGDGSGSIFAGSQDNGTELYSHGANGWRWKRLAMGDGFYTAVDPHNPSVLYHEFEEGKLQLSINGGAAWAYVIPAFAGQARSWGMPFKMDLNDAASLVAGAGQVFSTTTGGVSVNGAPGWIGREPTGLVKITAIDWKNGAQAVVGDSDGTYAYTFDGGNTWSRDTDTMTGAITAVKIDPYTDRTFWVASRDAENPFTPHLIRVSQPAGQQQPSITEVETGLSSPVESLLLLPGVLMAGTDRGIYVRSRFGGTWTAQTPSSAAPAIPAVPVVDLALRTYGQGNPTVSVVALTHGRGAWVSNDLAFIRPQSYAGMVLIPAGSFTMGDSLDAEADAMPTLNVNVSAFYMDENPVTYSQWRAVYQWATDHGYSFGRPGDGRGPNHPVSNISWYDMVKWCNARSEQAGAPPVYYTDAGLTSVYKTGNLDTVYPKWTAAGYRLPTEAEWEKAARGGLTGKRFPWGDTINQTLANYVGNKTLVSYDSGPNGNNPVGNGWTSPVGSFPANGYGLYDMAGNVWEWVWDWSGSPYAGGTDPHGPTTNGGAREMRGGSFYNTAVFARTGGRNLNWGGNPLGMIGFRTVLAPGH
jgi:formylglycine-generating enzyme required for sulfatase activity